MAVRPPEQAAPPPATGARVQGRRPGCRQRRPTHRVVRDTARIACGWQAGEAVCVGAGCVRPCSPYPPPPQIKGTFTMNPTSKAPPYAPPGSVASPVAYACRLGVDARVDASTEEFCLGGRTLSLHDVLVSARAAPRGVPLIHPPRARATGAAPPPPLDAALPARGRGGAPACADRGGPSAGPRRPRDPGQR